jgi:hypothetical protein
LVWYVGGNQPFARIDAQIECRAFELGGIDLGRPQTAGTTIRGDGEVVLVIDDEPTIRMLIGEVLQESGMMR